MTQNSFYTFSNADSGRTLFNFTLNPSEMKLKLTIHIVSKQYVGYRMNPNTG